MDSDYLPSKKFVKIVAIVIVGFIIVIGIKKGAPSLSSIFSGILNQEKQIDPELLEAYDAYRTLDTDGDGLYDWEEALFDTDINKVDTNGDGVSDYDEYQKAQLLTSVGQENSANFTDIPVNIDEVNVTDTIARDLYTSISIAKQQGGELSYEQNDELSRIAAEAGFVFQTQKFSLDDIVISPNANTGQTLMIQIDNLWSGSGLLVDDMKRILVSIENDRPISSDITARMDLYNGIVTNLRAVPVQNSVSSEYLDYVNSSHTFISAIKALANNDNDPTRALQAVTTIETIIDNLNSSYTRLSSKVKSN